MNSDRFIIRGYNGLSERRNQSLLNILFLLFFLNTINFFLTSNPYRAIHSGRTAYESAYTGSSFWISPAYIVLGVSMICAVWLLIKNRSILIDKIHLTFSFSFVIASLINGSVFSSPVSFLYNLLMYIITFVLASTIAVFHETENTINDESIIRFNNIILLLVAIGILFAYIQRDRYGVINFGFSRRTRGEITYWLFLGLHVIAIASSLTAYVKYRLIKYLVPAAIVLLFQLAFANRMGIVYIVVPLFVYLLFGTKASKRILVLIVVVFLVLVFWEELLALMGIETGISTSYVSFMNGRSVLWGYCLDELKKHLFFGAGLNITSQASYTGGAVSEVGLLKLFAENGVFVGILHVLMLGIGIYHAVNVIRLSKMKEMDTLDLFCAFYIISCFIPIIFESHSRILNITDFLAWFSMYYMYKRRILFIYE